MQSTINDFHYYHSSLMISRNKWFSKSSSIITMTKTSSSSSSYPNHLSYIYDSKLFSKLKRSTVYNLNREKLNDKLKQKAITHQKFDQYHHNTIRSNLHQNSAVFITKTKTKTNLDHNGCDYENHPQSLYNLTIKIDASKLGISRYPIYSSETINRLTQRCNEISRLTYLSRIQRKTLRNVENDNKHQKEEVEIKKNAILNGLKQFEKDIFNPIDKYTNYLYEVIENWSKELIRLREIQYLLAAEVKKQANYMDDMKEYNNRLASMRLFLICAKEAINTDKTDDEYRRMLFNGGYIILKKKNKSYYDNNNNNNNDSNNNQLSKYNSVLSYFHYALDSLTKNAKLYDYYIKKYCSNVFVFDSVEDFFEKTQFYENKIIELMKEYERRKNSNQELERTLKEITQFYNSIKGMDKLMYEEKERELQKGKALHDQLLRKKKELENNKINRISLQEFKVPNSISAFTSRESDKILAAFKYESMAAKYPIPYSCLLSRLCLIGKNIMNTNPNFLLFDETGSYFAFGAKDLQIIFNKRITTENEFELGDDIIKILKVIERSYKQLNLLFIKLSNNKTIHDAIVKINSNMEKEKKLTAIKQSRITMNRIRKRKMKNVEIKTYKVHFKIDKRQDVYKFRKTQSLSIKKNSSCPSLMNSDKNKVLQFQDILFY